MVWDMQTRVKMEGGGVGEGSIKIRYTIYQKN